MCFLQCMPQSPGSLILAFSGWIAKFPRNASGPMVQGNGRLQLCSHISMSACVVPVVSDDGFSVHQPSVYGLFSRTASTEEFLSSDDDKLLNWAQESMGTQNTIISDGLYLTILKACIKKKSIAVTRKVLSRLLSKKLEVTGLLYEHLILALAKCNAVDDAIPLFERLRCRTVFAWTAIISGLTEQNRHLEAIEMYEYMREEGTEPDRFTLISLLKACGSIPDIEKGRQLHILAKRMGLVSNIFVGNTLVNMYGKCGSVTEAECVFTSLTTQNVVSWTAMLTAYVENNCCDKALLLYRQMQRDGIMPNNQTFVCLLQACTILADMDHQTTGEFNNMASEIGKAVHVDALRAGHSSDPYVVTTLINLYGKYGAITMAVDIFTTQFTHNVASWTAMLSAFVEHDEGEKALLLYRQMCGAGIRPNERTIVSALQACCILAEKVEHFIKETTLHMGRAIHADIRNYRITMNSFLRNSLLRMYTKHGSIREAENVLGSLSEFTVVTWTSIISAYVEERQPEMALKSYKQMHEEGMQPNELTFVVAFQACSALAVLSFEKQPHMKTVCHSLCQSLEADVQRMGLTSDPFVVATLLSTYGKCGVLSQAEEVFCRSVKCDSVVWNAMLSLFVEEGLNDKALLLYKTMVLEGIPQDDTTIVSVMHSCCETGSVESCRELHFCVVSNGLDLCPTLTSSLIHLYGKCASVADAEVVYTELTQPDVVCSNAFIAIYSWQGNDDVSLEILHHLILEGSKPDPITFGLLLSACSHAGSFEKSIEFLECMKEIYGITPDLRHTISIVDLLGRARDMNRFKNILQGIPMPTGSTMRSFFGKYYGHNNLR